MTMTKQEQKVFNMIVWLLMAIPLSFLSIGFAVIKGTIHGIFCFIDDAKYIAKQIDDIWINF